RKGRNGAHIAPPRDCRANTMPPPAQKGSGDKQTKYESDTPPHGLRFANKASQIFRFPVEPVNIIPKSSACSRPACLKWRHWRTIRRTNGEGIGHSQIAGRRASKASPIAASMRHPQTSSPNRRPVGPAPCLKQGLAGLSVGQTVKESASPNRRAPRFKG